MGKITLTSQNIFKEKADCYGFFVQEGFKISSFLKEIDGPCADLLKSLVKEREFEGKTGQHLVLPFIHERKMAHVVLLGLGKKSTKWALDIERYRRVLGKLVRIAEQHKCSSIALALPSPKLFDADAYYIAEQTAMITDMAHYHFDEFITKEGRKVHPVDSIIIGIDKLNKKEVESGINDGRIIGDAVNQTRYWIDLPPSKLTPPELAKKAHEIAKKNKLKITCFDEKEAKQMGMGGLVGVSRGSKEDCQFVVLEYSCGKKTAPTICFVGKGITFDSGGLSLKPPAYMETMKEDMSGAAAVISAMGAIAKLKPKVNVVGITPLAENLPSGTATKPGDIITFYNGKTAEVKNTDAEGRLVLADALAYAVKHYKPAAIVDVATLTGACAYALGPFFTGLMSQDEDLIERLQESAEYCGDRVWELPLNDDYKPAIKSAVADISNIGSRKYNAGAITAAFFLKEFVNDTPWAHLDIAGTAFNVPDISYYRRESATGAAVRLLIDLAMHWA